MGSIWQKFVAVTSSQVSTSFTTTKKINYVIFFSSLPSLLYERARERPIVFFKDYSTYLPTTCMKSALRLFHLSGRFRAESTAEAAGVPVSGSLGYLPAIAITISAHFPPPRLLSSRTTAPTCGMRVGRTVRVGPARLILICRGQGRWDQGRCDPSRVFGWGTVRGTQDRVAVFGADRGGNL